MQEKTDLSTCIHSERTRLVRVELSADFYSNLLLNQDIFLGEKKNSIYFLCSHHNCCYYNMEINMLQYVTVHWLSCMFLIH